MRLRITVGLVAILVVALVLAGGASLLLVRRAGAQNAQATVLRETNRLVAATRAAGLQATRCTDQTPTAPSAGQAPTTGSAAGENCVNFAELLPLIESIAGISEAGLLIIGPNGQLAGGDTLAPGLPKSLFAGDPARRLAKGESISGVYGGHAYAAAQLLPATAGTGGTSAAIVLEVPISNSFANIWYFLVAGVISLVVAAGIAVVFTSRVARGVRASARTAEQIAGGDLGARVASGPHDYPELRALTESINTMAAGLEQARELERHFLLSISHDLRTPLTSIRGYAEAITDGAAVDHRRAAEVIVAQSDRLQRLIGDLLQLARLESRNFDFEMAEIDLGPVLAEAVTALAYSFESAGIALELELGETAVRVRADVHRLTQVVANLLENALKFARARVVVRLLADGATARVVVEDDGPGIAPADLPHIFERLFTAGREEARQAGTGLGLAIVAELCAAMGIDVEAVSPLWPSGGTRLELCLKALEPATVPGG